MSARLKIEYGDPCEVKPLSLSQSSNGCSHGRRSARGRHAGRLTFACRVHEPLLGFAAVSGEPTPDPHAGAGRRCGRPGGRSDPPGEPGPRCVRAFVRGRAGARRAASVYAAASPMPDLLDRIRKELDARIRELRPVVREFERLEHAAGALARAGARSVPGLRSRVAPAPAERDAAAAARGKRGARSAAAKPRARATSPARRGAASRRKPAPRGQTQAKVLAALAAAPGSGPAAVAKASGVSAGVAAATLSRLAKQGRVRRLEAGGYAIVEAPGRRSDGAPAAAQGAAEQTSVAHAKQVTPPPEQG